MPKHDKTRPLRALWAAHWAAVCAEYRRWEIGDGLRWRTHQRLKVAGCALLIFCCGYIVAANLSKLGYGEHYEAAWWKVGLALFLVPFWVTLLWPKR